MIQNWYTIRTLFEGNHLLELDYVELVAHGF
jgi:hypothetical protein